MGGEVGLDSEPGKGSCFRFTLPLRKTPESARRRRPGELSGLRVLIVDDNETNRTILQAQVSSWGMQAEQAPDGPSALDMLGAAWRGGQAFDIALVDMQMPDMDGSRSGQIAKADPAIAGVPLIMLTSMGTNGEKQRALQAGYASHLTKPVRQSHLFDAGGQRAVHADRGARRRRPGPRPRPAGLHRDADSGQRPLVLVAEDNVVNRRSRSACSRSSATAATSWPTAPRRRRPCAASVRRRDHGLPDAEMDGYEATAKIRGMDGNRAPHAHHRDDDHRQSP
jgi:CheY-like chemotaxis protein